MCSIVIEYYRYNSAQWTHCQSVVTQGTAEEEEAEEEERGDKNGRAKDDEGKHSG